MSSLPLFELPLSSRPRVHRAFVSGLAMLLVVGVLLASPAARAQASRTGQITQVVNEDERFVLSGNTHPLATKAADRGAVPASMAAERMLIVLRRSPEQELALRGEIEALHDSNSPSFHKWLTPEQFGAQWGAADADIAAVTAWLESHGFQVKGPTTGRTAIEFSGTAGQVEEAFHTAIHTYMVNGELHHANTNDPEIPAALAPVVAGITALNDFHPHALAKKGPRGIFDPSTQRVKPDLTTTGASSDFLYVVPADAATIYNSPIKSLNPAASGPTVDGSGAKIGILGDSNISLAQNANYRKRFGLSANAPTVIIDGGKDPGINGDAVEAYLDTEVANGVAPGAKIYFYTAADTAVSYGLDLATLRAVNDNIVDVLNMSFGACEGGLGTAANQFYEEVWQQAAAQGISVTVSTGDSGSAGCDDPNTQTVAYYGLQVNGLASTPFNIAVGGTDFAVLAGPDGSGANFTNYVSAKNEKGTLGSALGYIPEVPWNDTSFTFPPGTIGNSKAAPNPYWNIVAAGGGKSNCSNGSVNSAGNLVCKSGYAKPSWQNAPGVPADHARDLPDVSLFAANGLYYGAWGICTDQDSDTNGNPIKDCTPGSDGLPAGQFYIYGVGGTSASAPAFAGMLALIKQSTGERQGQADYVLYNLARTASSTFHDVVTGNNGVPCQAGTADCNKNSKGSYYLSGYNATAGYDLASGLGSVDVSALLANWASAGLKSTTTHLTVTPASVEHGHKINANATVTTSGGTATGEVALTAIASPPITPPGIAIGTYPLGAGGSTGSIAVNGLDAGNYHLIASYGGSTAFTLSVSTPVAVAVTSEPSITKLTATSTNPISGGKSSSTTIPYGYPVDLKAVPYGVNSPIVAGVVQPDGIATGTVTFEDGVTGLGSRPLNPDGSAVSASNLPSPGPQSIQAMYKGDKNFQPSTGKLVLHIVKGETMVHLTSSANRNTGKPIVFTAELSTTSAGEAPTGNIAIEDGTKIYATGKIVGVVGTSDLPATGTVVITTTNLPMSDAKLKAVYLGDDNYAGSISNLVALKARPHFDIKNISVTLPAEHSTAAAFMEAKSEDGYSGTIKFTCKLVGPYKGSNPPECAMYRNSYGIASGRTVHPQILIFGKGTKLPPGVTMTSDNTRFGLGLGIGGAALACCLWFGIPARRRGWQSMLLSLLLLLVAASGFTACVTPAKIISVGGYTFQVTGTDSADPTNTTTATVKVNVL